MSPSVPTRPDTRALRELLERVVGGLGGDLEELVEQRAGSRRLIRLAVDRDGGVTLDDVAEFSKAVSAALDESDVMGETPYVLEVTSPGVGRPLTAPRHWRRAVTRLVQVDLREGGQLVGRVTGSDDEAVVLDVNGAAQRIEYARIAKAKVQVEFNRAGADADGADDPDLDEDAAVDDDADLDDDDDADAYEDADVDEQAGDDDPAARDEQSPARAPAGAAAGDDDDEARIAGADES